MKKYLAEAIGTFVLTFLGCAAAVSLGCSDANTAAVVGTAFAFGLSVVAMAYTIGGISGCHINPAITLGCLLTGRISAKDCAGYMAGQFVGAIVAGAALCGFYGCESGLGANGIGAGCDGSVAIAVAVEAVLTALFVLVVLGATGKDNESTGKLAGLAIGLSLVLIHLVGIHFTGTSVNPARSVGPALFVCGDALKNVWVFIVGPFAGAVVAAGLWKAIEVKK
ncbi:MAG: aquaporin [Bacteroidales bacterium]|uniref:aquaporin n=1 Tax=Sodaliphilus sp. TaxID=2815818 RepID=UPI001B510597|nr:aquaporin [Candidatus Sodaliphilus limicaballi]